MDKNLRVVRGVVVSAGKMMKAVKVRTAKQVYNDFLKKVSIDSSSPPALKMCRLVL